MASLSLELSTPLGAIVIDCDAGRAPRTLQALVDTLPRPVQFHTPKIAGTHIYWHAPFVEDVEAAVDVMSAEAGTFLYWPERQFLEIVFAPLQAETATVTVLGRAEAPSRLLVQLGDHVRRAQGHMPAGGVLTVAEAPVPKQGRKPLVDSDPVCRDMWSAAPDEIDRLVAGRGIMHPLGPAVYAESEARGAHEMLWWHRKGALAGHDGHRDAAAAVLDKAATRLAGFCHLPRCAEAVRQVCDGLSDRERPALEAFDRAILLVGRLAGWLDLVLPWEVLNETMRRCDDARRAGGGKDVQ